MPSNQTLIAFAFVSAGIMLVPGPSNFFILAQGLGHGRRSALGAVLGVSIASALRVLLAAAGLLAVLASSAVAFEVIRWGGVAYLAYLGIRACRSRPGTATGASDAPTAAVEPAAGRPAAGRTTLRAVWRGVLVGLGNPKMILFFVAFFPQFIDPASGSTTGQILALGAVFWIIGVAWDLGFAYFSGSVGTWLRRRPRLLSRQGRFEGAAYLGLAVWAAFTGAEA